MGRLRAGLVAAAVALALTGVGGCAADTEDEIARSGDSSAPTRDLNLDVGVIIHADGTHEYPETNVTLGVERVLPAP